MEKKMIKVNLFKDKIIIKRVSNTKRQWKDIEGIDGNTYRVEVPGSVKSVIDFTYTGNPIFSEKEIPEQLKNEFSPKELDSIMEKQKITIQKNISKLTLSCSKAFKSILTYKNFIVGGQDVNVLADQIKELQGVLKKI